MRRFLSISAVLLVLAVISTPVLAQYQQGPGQTGKPRGQAHQHLQGGHPVLGNLSEEQQEAMIALFAEYRTAMSQHSLLLRAKQAELDVLLAAPEFQQAQVDAVTAEIIALKGKALNLKNELRRKVFEETGHLMRGKGGRCPGMAECGKRSQRSRPGRSGNCPKLSGLNTQ